MSATPVAAVERLRDATRSGHVDDLGEGRGLPLMVAFGSAARGKADARDLDIAIWSSTEEGDVLSLVSELADLAGTDEIDILDLDRVAVASAMARPLYRRFVSEVARFLTNPTRGGPSG